jgi:hypothetical protein
MLKTAEKLPVSQLQSWQSFKILAVQRILLIIYLLQQLTPCQLVAAKTQRSVLRRTYTYMKC